MLCLLTLACFCGVDGQDGLISVVDHSFFLRKIKEQSPLQTPVQITLSECIYHELLNKVDIFVITFVLLIS